VAPRSDYVGPTAVQAALLPARAVYLVADGSAAGLRRAVQEASTRWGGMTEPIIPVNPGGDVDPWWKQVVTIARADGAVNVDVPAEDAAIAAGALGLELTSLKDIDRAGLTSFSVHPAFVGPAHTADFNGYVICNEGSTLCDAIGAGDLGVEHLAGLSSDLLAVSRAPDDQLARAQLSRTTLVERTCSQFGEYMARGGLASTPAVIWVTEPESFSDCIMFWNLRALRPLRLAMLPSAPMLILPVGQVERWMGFPNQVAYALERPEQFAPDVALCSISVSETVLDETAAVLGLERYTGQPRTGWRDPAPTRKAPFTYMTGLEVRQWLVFERSYGTITGVDVQLFRDKTNIQFTSPVTFTGGGTNLVRFSGPVLDGLPRRLAVAARIAGGATWRDNDLQLTTFATNDYRFEVHIPELPEVVDALLSGVTVRHEISDKGKPGMAWLDRSEISPLLEPSVFTTIRQLTTPRSKELLRELRKLRAAGEVDETLSELAAHWGGRSERRYRSAGQLESVAKEAAPTVLERLCDVGWAERGLRVVCGLCRLPSFIEFRHTSGRATCPGCGSPASYETSDVLTVYYRLNSYLDLLSDQGILPHLLTIACLTRQGKDFHFLPGVNIWFDAEGQDKAEADIFGVCDGKVISGEVKTSSSEFTDDQIARDVRLSSRLGVDKHVLAATDDVPENAARKAQEECDAAGLDLVVLRRTDLLPD
jgi:hypothetical protein